MRAVFRHALLAHGLSFGIALLVAYTLWGVADHGRIKWWLVIMAAASGMRAAVTLGFRAREREPGEMVFWERAFVISFVIASLAWGVGALWIMPRDSLAHQAFIYFILSGVGGGALASYAAHPTACVLAISSLMLPCTIWFATHNVLELRAMAVAGTIYVATGFRSLRSFRFFLRRTFQLSFELQDAYDRARHLALTDPLTGLNNRRAFTEAAEKAVEHARRYGRPISLVMFDVDHFKRINDSRGHAGGDRVLQELAEAVRRTVRIPDIAGRLGGEEFAVLLPETTGSHGAILAERLRQAMASARATLDGQPVSFTCSFGVAAAGDGARTVDQLLSRADQALYRAKADGRNRVAVDELVLR